MWERVSMRSIKESSSYKHHNWRKENVFGYAVIWIFDLPEGIISYELKGYVQVHITMWQYLDSNRTIGFILIITRDKTMQLNTIISSEIKYIQSTMIYSYLLNATSIQHDLLLFGLEQIDKFIDEFFWPYYMQNEL